MPIDRPSVVSIKEPPILERKPPEMEGFKISSSFSAGKAEEDAAKKEEPKSPGPLDGLIGRIKSLFGKK